MQMREVRATDKLQLRLTLRFYTAHLDEVFEVAPSLVHHLVPPRDLGSRRSTVLSQSIVPDKTPSND